MSKKPDRIEECFDSLMGALEEGEFAASDVMYAIGKVIAYGIVKNAANKDPAATFALLRGVVDLEMPLIRPREVKALDA